MRFLLIAGVLLSAIFQVCAQEQTLTELEFSEIVSKAEKGLVTRGPYRMLLETDVTTEGVPSANYRSRSVSLFIPGQGQHRTEERVVGGQPSKSEMITLHERSFSRGTDGKWKELERKAASSSAPQPIASSDRQTIEQSAECRYLGIETYEGRRVQVYTKTERRRSLNTNSGTTSEAETLVKVRVSADGDYFRYESNAKTLSGERPGRIKILIESQADPTISLHLPQTSN